MTIDNSIIEKDIFVIAREKKLSQIEKDTTEEVVVDEDSEVATKAHL